jgi:hypothetical protein
MLLQQQQQPVTPTVVPVEEQKEEIKTMTPASKPEIVEHQSQQAAPL